MTPSEFIQGNTVHERTGMTVRSFIKGQLQPTKDCKVRILVGDFPLVGTTPVADLELSDELWNAKVDRLSRGPVSHCTDITILTE